MEPNYEIKENIWPDKTYIIQRATVSFDKLSEFFSKSYGAIYSQIHKLGITTNEPPCAIYYQIDEEMKETDMAAAVPVKEPLPEIRNLKKVVIPQSKVITVTHYGSYESMMPAYRAMEKYLNDHNLKKELIIEEYFSDPEKEKDPSQWKTNIHFILKS